MEWWLNHVGQMAQSVQDYSTSRIICEKWKQIDNRIILYRQKNQGVSEARNQGIKKHLVNIHYL